MPLPDDEWKLRLPLLMDGREMFEPVLCGMVGIDRWTLGWRGVVTFLSIFGVVKGRL